MPFTPFHLGAGAACKAIGSRYFSFMVFGGAQVLMDIEPLVRIFLGTPRLHGITHTVAGALLIGLAAGVIGKPVSEFVLGIIVPGHDSLTWVASFNGALIGTLSHVLLDAVMHSDMEPFVPFYAGNPFLGLISVSSLHLLLIILGIIGGVGVAIRYLKERRPH